MINANELRINNLVKDRGGKILRVDEILKDRVSQSMYLEGVEVHGMNEYFEYLQPIPLTEEILLKCGFEKIEYNSEETGCGIEYVLIRGGYSGFRLEYYEDFSIGIMGSENDQAVTPNVDVLCYLHQLQNLYFALTGEELKIEI